MKAPGLSGTYTVDEGFAKLLADSGLRARVVSTGNYALASAPKNPPDVVPAPAKASTPHAVTPAAQDAKELATVTVSVTRLEQSTEDAPQNIRVISRDEIDKQLAVTSSTTQILSNLIPSMTPAMQKMTNYGQTMRGLQPLVMVDGIPQSSPMYTSIGRDMTTIDPSMIERIEVIQGANSANGIGGMGGAINIITKQAKGGKPRQHVSAEATTPTSQLKGETMSYKTTYGITGSKGDFDYLLNLSYQNQGAYLDGWGNRVGTYDDQGDLMDSRSYDVMAKLGYAIDDNQHIGLTINRFRIKNDNHYSLVSGDRDKGVPTSAQRVAPPGSAPYNDSWTVGANYVNDDLNGMKLNASAYYQGVDSLFRGNTKFLANKAYDQSHAKFDKYGAKIALTSADFMDKTMRAVVGLDVMHENSNQKLLHSNLFWIPDITYTGISPFAQLEYAPIASVKVVGGIRYEHANVDVDSFTTLPRYGSKFVEGGKFSFGKTLFNAGASWSPVEPLNLFANFSQGFKVPDMGKAIRGISVDGARLSMVSYFKPDVADNYEMGFRVKVDKLALQASYFQTRVKPGTVISYVNDQWIANRSRTQIDGVELTSNYQLNSSHELGLGYAHSRGRFDINGDGKVDTKLDGANISPDRLSLNWSAKWSERLTSALQANWYFKRSFDGNNAVNTLDASKYRFSGYGLVDLSVGYKLDHGQLTVGVANLFDRKYITYYSQSAIVGNDYFFAGQGRTLTVGYRHDF
ncbi:TonB-dependent receptor [Diaphorobacter sp. HDW4A]|nr:TonB-dependent receptor [Diaphorobacter sp. HDW4A]